MVLPLPRRVWTGEIVDGYSGTWLAHPIGIFSLLGRAGVPWSEKSVMSQWHEFVMLFEQEGENRRQLGRRFGVSPMIGYRLWACWRTAGKGVWRTGRAARSIRPGAARRRWKAWC